MPTLGPQFPDKFAEAIARGRARPELPYPPTEINKAIDSYAARIPDTAVQGPAPYNAESLAEIYHPRVRELMDLQSQGFTHAQWRHDPEKKENRWFGHTPESPEVKKAKGR